MAQRNTYDQDESQEEHVNVHELLRVRAYIKPYIWQLVRVVLVVISGSIIMTAMPMITKILIDVVLPSKNVTYLYMVIAVFALLIVLYELGLAYRTLAITRLGQLIIKDMRRDIFTHVQSLSFDYFDSRPHGKILIRIVNYINTLSDTLSSGLINVFSDVFVLIITLITMFVIDWRMALWSLVLFPIFIIWTRTLQILQKKASKKLSNKQSNLNAYLHESIAGVKTTQTFAREATAYNTFQEQQSEVRSAWMRNVRVQLLLWPGASIIETAAIALLYYVGITNVGAMNVSTGTLIAFIWYSTTFWDPVVNIGNFYTQLVTCSVYLERIFETLGIKPNIVDKPDAEELPQIKGKVDVNDVVFRYEDDGKPILNLVDLHVEPGTTVALVGPTGAGKTTLVSLLSRFYDVSEGSITIDGHDVRSVTLASLRKQMGVMLQDSFIFSGTVRENIRYGKLDATDEEIEAAARVVHAHEFIEGLPNGYDTEIEELSLIHI